MGRATGGFERWLNAATAVLLAAAAALLVRDRLLPAWRTHQVVEVGEAVPGDLGLVSLVTGDTAALESFRPALLLHFQSTCPACTRNLPAWRRLLEERPSGVPTLAVGLERRLSARDYVRERLNGATAVGPVDMTRTTHLLGVEAVPTTQVVDRNGRLLWSRTGVLTDADVDRVLDRIRRVSPAGTVPAGFAPISSPSGRTP